MAGERRSVPDPVFRSLRVFAVDPGVTARGVENEMTVRIPWETGLEPGPCGEYIAIVDEDAHGTVLHPPLDLDSPDVLARGGLAPSDGDPHFRQQMAFTVAMKTIDNFERALGRPVHWPPERRGPRSRQRYRRRLNIYPHFRRIANAWYDPRKGVCLGYVRTAADGGSEGRLVFTCLSQDVIAHSVTHALLAGMNIEFQGTENSDQSALHEAFADLVALFQHFGEGDALRGQIAAVRGDLRQRSLLGAVAPQFGAALGLPDGIRNALGATDDQGRWQPREPDPALYRTLTEQHARGDILVGAVFLAFSRIYDDRIADLCRIASKGTGILPDGALHPDLVHRMAHEAAVAAEHVQRMCIRALDYLPPVDVTFGDFLRAIVTADRDMVPSDERRYRVAFQEAFAQYGIEPSPGGTVSVETLMWRAPGADEDDSVVTGFLQELSREVSYWSLPQAREELWKVEQGWRGGLTAALKASAAGHPRLGPVDLADPFDVLSLDLRERTGPAGDVQLLWVMKVMQRPRRGSPPVTGCTLLVDADSCRVRYRIDKSGSAAAGTPDELLRRASTGRPAAPRQRALRVFAADPTLGAELATAGINEVTLRVPWEDDLEPGPVGEYLEVIDHDPGSGSYYEPVELDDRRILAQDGLTPSESDPQFHQQMAYAVPSQIIRDFEEALGRRALWSPRRARDEDGGWQETFVRRLRVHPHALREANAYYSPAKKALLFGYFTAAETGGVGGGRQTVFTCLSHDIVAHEVTHALLDGIHRRFSEPSNPDVYALHEAFADIVALFEHFSLPDVLRHQIAATRGDLASQNRLGELAQQFGQATGNRSALRSAIGERDPDTGEWRPIEPDRDAYRRELEPHARGSILVAAVFDAFLTMYKARVADLLRIATEGTGVLPAGQLHPDLVTRMADEAASVARRVLQMCIRALDYCPPVDVTFGDYLRALLTADFEVDAHDAGHRRVAFAEAFRRYGIVPAGVRTLSVDGLLWRPTQAAPDEDERIRVRLVCDWAVDIASFGRSRDRAVLFELMQKRRIALHGYLRNKMRDPSEVLSGIDLDHPFEVHSIRPSMGRDWSGRPRFNWIVELTQRIPQHLGPDDVGKDDRRPDYWFRGGSTLVLDAATGRVRYSIRKPLDDARREAQRRYLLDDDGAADGGTAALAATYFGGLASEHREPFAMLHRR